jgi:hypothetical protein
MWFAVGLFIFSLGAILSLFALKEWEGKRESIVLPGLRRKADAFALKLKAMLIGFQQDLEKLPGEMLHLLRIAIHEAMIAAAGLLRLLERKAHELADLVSHKHRFERRASRSEFLQKVLDHKNESNQGEEG